MFKQCRPLVISIEKELKAEGEAARYKMNEKGNPKNEVAYCGICGCKFEIVDLVEVRVTAQGKSQADEAISGRFSVKACGMCLQCLLKATEGALEMLPDAATSMEGWKSKSISGKDFKDTQIKVEV